MKRLSWLRFSWSWAAAAAVTGTGAVAWPYTVDDAFISARYAQRIAAGLGYTFSGQSASDGVTGPLWLLPQLAAIEMGADPVVVAKGLGLVCAGGAAALVVRRAEMLGCSGWVAAALVGCQSSLGIWSVAGLETGLAVLLFSCAALALVARRASWLAGLWLAALAWLRPELGPAGLVILLVLTRRDLAAGVRATLVALGGVCVLLAFRLFLFGEALPLSFHAKGGTLGSGLRYVTLGLLLTTGVGGVGLTWRAGATSSFSRGLALAIAVQLITIGLLGGDWMPGQRLIAPLLPAYALLGARGADTRDWSCRAMLLLALALPALQLSLQLPEARRAGQTREAVARPLALWLRDNAATMALVDAGYLSYASGIEVVDLGGLTDPIVAHSPGGHLSKRVDVGYLQQRDPDVVVLHSTSRPRVAPDGRLLSLPGAAPVESRLAASGWFRHHYRVVKTVRYTSRYYYVVASASPQES
ncbi:MAG: hypothetical protein MJD61_06140 [Proteobacteria bacterium]|nr:hypothetical protein [Pseudomonadota bacterium]